MSLFLRILPKAVIIIALSLSSTASIGQEYSIAREWNEALLFAIRNDFARPPIHARNLWHLSAVMYDAWAVYDELSEPYLLGNTIGDFNCEFNGVPSTADIESHRETAISYAAYRLLSHRFTFSPGAEVSLEAFDNLMADLGYDTEITGTDYSSGEAAQLGNYIAEQMIAFGLQDGSNEIGDYSNLYYTPSNGPLDMTQPGNASISDPNLWQPLELPLFIDQAGNPFTASPPFQSPEWGNAQPFALTDEDKTTYFRDGNAYHVYLEPAPPPLIDTLGPRENDDIYRWGFSLVSIWQGHHDPNDEVLWDISPASIGNVSEYPEEFSEYPDFYNLLEGGDTGTGYELNPKTGLPYEPQIVPRADYTRVLAEFWADGPASETPPGHWYTILNTVHDHPEFERRWEGEGPLIDDLEWDVKAYFVLGGAVHDAAIAAWSIKGWFDYVRPVSAIRYMADQGQNTDPDLPSYHPAGIPLQEGYIELVTDDDPLAGDEGEHVGKIKLFTWKGPDYIEDPETEYAGVDWILAENWWPYQRPTFVTPPFAGYISGHSTFSRAAAEALTRITGDPYFPGGMGEFFAPQNDFLVFEEGPSENLTLQWATYRDASDQCSLSRIWGGIHPPVDDIPGRLIGIEVGNRAFEEALEYIQAGLPRVTEMIPQSEVINLDDVGNPFSITVVFDQEMNTDDLASLLFENDNPQNTLINPEQNWLSNDTLILSWEVFDSEEVLNDISLQIEGLTNLDGLPLFEQSFDDLFAIDLIAPQAINVETPAFINREEIGNAFEIEILFNKAMDINQLPSFEFNNATLNTLLIEVPENHTWINTNRLELSFSVSDLALELDDFEIEISDISDASGNALISVALPGGCTIDTRTPELLSASPSHEDVTTLIAGEAGFTLTLIFDEAMNTSELPLLFLSATQDALTFNEDASAWTDEYTFVAAYDVSADFENVANVNLGVSQAFDVLNNPIVPVNFSQIFTLNGGVAITEINGDQAHLAPNPWQPGLPLQIFSDAFKGGQWQLMASDGRVVEVGKIPASAIWTLSNRVSHELSPGIYFIQLISGQKSTILKLLVVSH